MADSALITWEVFDSEPPVCLNDSSLSVVSNADPDEFDLLENPSEELQKQIHKYIVVMQPCTY